MVFFIVTAMKTSNLMRCELLGTGTQDSIIWPGHIIMFLMGINWSELWQSLMHSFSVIPFNMIQDENLPHFQLGPLFSFVVLLYVVLFPNPKRAPYCFVCVVRSCVLSHCAGPKVCLAHPWWSEHSLALATSQLAGAGPYASSIHNWQLTTRRSGLPHKTVPVSCLEISRVSTEKFDRVTYIACLLFSGLIIEVVVHCACAGCSVFNFSLWLFFLVTAFTRSDFVRLL